MSTVKKVLAVVVAVVLLVALAMTATAATGNKTVNAGKSVTVTFTYKNSYSLDGQFSVNDPKGIIDGTPTYSIKNRDGMAGGQVSGDKCFLYDTSNPATAHDVVVSAVVKIKSSAKVGDTCSITFKYNRGTEGTGMNVQKGEDTATIEVVKKSTKPTETDKPGTGIDRTELEKQIAIAEGLNEKDYTAESWAALMDALKNAWERMTTGTQDDVDAAAKQLEAAIAALVKIDRSKLVEAMANGKNLCDNKELNDLLQQLVDAMLEGERLLNSNDQAAIDACAARINALAEQIRALLKQLLGEQEPTVQQPEGLYCNVPMHPVWIIIAIISLIGNVALVVVIVTGKKKNKK